jgi:hypothetical protein
VSIIARDLDDNEYLVGTGTGWSAFVEWAKALPDPIGYFATTGFADNPKSLAQALHAHVAPDPDVDSTRRALIDTLDAAVDALMVTGV